MKAGIISLSVFILQTCHYHEMGMSTTLQKTLPFSQKDKKLEWAHQLEIIKLT